MKNEEFDQVKQKFDEYKYKLDEHKAEIWKLDRVNTAIEVHIQTSSEGFRLVFWTHGQHIQTSSEGFRLVFWAQGQGH